MPRRRPLPVLIEERADTAWIASAAEREGFKCIARNLWRKVARLDRKIDRLTKTSEERWNE